MMDNSKKLFGAFSTIAVIIAFIPALANTIPENLPCPSSGEILKSLYQKDGGDFYYREDNPASPYSSAKFEFWRDGQLLWDADVERGCSEGIGRCWLMVPYQVDGQRYDILRSEWNNITMPDGQQLVLLSHLEDKIASKYFKDMPFRDISLEGNSYHGTDYPRREGLEIPSVFKVVKCSG